MQTAKSVSYHLKVTEDFRIHCLMALNANKGFDPTDFASFKKIVSKIKNNKELTISDKIILRERLPKYTWELAGYLNKMTRRGSDKSKMTKEVRRQAAQAQVGKWQQLSPRQQLAELDKRLGKGQGAVRQRARLQAKLEKPQD